MQTSVIRYRVADFLKQYPPFDALPEHDLLELAGSGRVKFHESEEYVYQQGQAPRPFVWILQQGRVDLLDERPGSAPLRDVAGEGDLLGLERLAGHESYLYSARTATDVILYSIDAGILEDLTARHPAVKDYLAAHFSVPGTLGIGRSSWLDAKAPPLEFLRARLAAVGPDFTWAEAASRLSHRNRAVVAVVDGGGRARGLLTAADVCRAVAGASDPAVAPSPTVAAGTSTRQAVREMLRTRSEALAVTGDGRPDSPLQAILTASDLALFCGHNPARLVREILEAGTAAEVVPLLAQGTRLVLDALAQPADVDDGARLGSAIAGALAEAGVTQGLGLAGRDSSRPAAPHCWVTFGSTARGELLRPAVPRLAVLYDDSHAACTPQARDYFGAVTGHAAGWLQECGLERAGASLQPCLSLSEWKQYYSETIRDPVGHDLFERREFFDIRLLAGNPSVFQALHAHIASELGEQELLLPLLANDTLSHLPPLTFYRGLVLDLDGAQRDSLDLAGTALHPISDAARVFALRQRNLSLAGTLERLEAAGADFPEQESIFREAALAFRIALYHQTIAGAAVIHPATLGRYDQRLVKTAFTSILRLLELTTSTFLPAA